MSGTCRFCSCREDSPCPGGCAWVDQGHVVCSACVDCARAWLRCIGAKKPKTKFGDAMSDPLITRAFFRGFAAATGDPRVRSFVTIGDLPLDVNPYTGTTSRYFDLGFDAGEQLAALLS